MAYDVGRSRVVLFGGDDASGFRNDTWEWDGSNWKSVAASGPVPHARSLAAMAYDSSRQRIVLFGGYSGTFLNDTWEYDGQGWAEVQTTGRPSPRYHTSLAYDSARARVVLFGGATMFPSTGFQQDTWEFDGSNWIQRMPSVIPPARQAHGMTFDSTRGRTLVFGGNGVTTAYLNDLWSWDGTDWTQVASAPNVPSPRSSPILVHDPLRRLSMVFGGEVGAYTLAPPTTHAWDGTEWRQLGIGSAPQARGDHRAAFDAARGVVLMYGGSAYTARFGDTWVLRWPAPSTSPFGAACAGTTGLATLSSVTVPLWARVFRMRVDNAPRNCSTAFLLGLSNTSWAGRPLPMDFTGAGMTGCNLYVSLDYTAYLSTGGVGWYQTDVPIPSDPALVGIGFFTQFAIWDARANPLGITTTNALANTIGF